MSNSLEIAANSWAAASQSYKNILKQSLERSEKLMVIKKHL